MVFAERFPRESSRLFCPWDTLSLCLCHEVMFDSFPPFRVISRPPWVQEPGLSRRLHHFVERFALVTSQSLSVCRSTGKTPATKPESCWYEGVAASKKVCGTWTSTGQREVALIEVSTLDHWPHT